MADLLTRVQRELDERLAELRPLVEEARQLEQALAALTPDRDEAPRPARRYYQRPPVAEAPPATPASAAASKPAVESAPEPAAQTTSEAAEGPSPSRTKLRSGARDRSGPTLRSTPTGLEPRRRSTRRASTEDGAGGSGGAGGAGDGVGQRRRRALAIITENPGTTAGTLALLLDTSVAAMGALLKLMEREGDIERAEKGFARRTDRPAAND